jgi:predicted TIM-barrel fold metal-dependent hydrolase
VIDGHCHLDSTFSTCGEALESLYQESRSVGIKKIVLLNIPGSSFGGQRGFCNEEVIHGAKAYGDFFYVFPAINPLEAHAVDKVKAYKLLGIAGIKLHPRIHQYSVENQLCVDVVKEAGAAKLPVLICGFPDGLGLKLGNIPSAFGRLADKAPETKIAYGHSGGHYIIDAMMIAKACKNIYLDLSFSLLYYQKSGVPNDLAYAIQSMQGKKIFWGTDYPDRPYAKTVEMSLAAFDKLRLADEFKEAILSTNIYEFLGLPCESS